MGTTSPSSSPETQTKAPTLLTTKLHPPPRREQTIERERLIERLRPRVGVKLTVVAAPAGSGKTTLLGMWHDAEAARRPVAWVSLDEGDNECVVLWSHVEEALRQVCQGLDLPPFPATVSSQRMVDVVLPRLVNELAAYGDVALVLDDFHRLSSGHARDSVAWFIKHAPSTLQLLVASRNEPALPLAALRAHGELLEVRADELAFTSAEAHELLNGRLELALAFEDIDRLVERTEGWPAGLYLAALSLRGAENRETFVARFGSKNRHILDFLVDEVLDAHDPAMRSLMLRSSILERLSGPLCDSVLEREGCAQSLRELARTNLFLMPLDDDGEWYRFHTLFAQLLRIELEHREPRLAPTLHLRASAWLCDQGALPEAIDHAFRAGAFEEAVAMINTVWLETLSTGRRATILGWFKRLPPELLHDDHRLLLVQAWTYSFSGDREAAEAATSALERIGWPEGETLPEGSGTLEASLVTMRAGFSGGDVGRGLCNALRAAELESPKSPLWSAVCWALGVNSYFQGNLDEADRAFATAAEAGASNVRWLLATSALAYRSLIAGERGQADRQRVLADEAVALARERGIDELSGEVHVAAGESFAARGELDEALAALARGVAVSRPLAQPLTLANALLRLAALFRATNRPEAASAALADARKTIDSCPDPGVLRQRLAALERPERSQARGRDESLTGRELAVLRMLRGSLSERDIGRELYLSHNTIHSHTRSIYRKLGVSSRKQAVNRAITLGIL